jgi:hypothetical protein
VARPGIAMGDNMRHFGDVFIPAHFDGEQGI